MATTDDTPSAPAPRAGPAEAETIDAGELSRRLADLTLYERVERGLDTFHEKGPAAGMRQVVVEYRPVRLGDVPGFRDLLAAWRAAEEDRDKLGKATRLYGAVLPFVVAMNEARKRGESRVEFELDTVDAFELKWAHSTFEAALAAGLGPAPREGE